MLGSRFLRLSVAIAAAPIAALALVEPFVAGRTRPPAALESSVARALAAARASDAGRWAPDLLPVADQAFAEGLAEAARQRARLAPRRDFSAASEAYWRAATAVLRAQRVAVERREEARLGADEALAETRELHRHADALVAHTTLPAEERLHLQKSRLLLGEAGVRYVGGDYAESRRDAEQSMAELGKALGRALDVARRYTSEEQLAQWRRWEEQARSWSRVTGRPAILVFKEKNQLLLVRGGSTLRSYAADMGANAIGAKMSRGDRATPEGRYRVVKKKDRGQSVYHRALLLDYPNEADRRRVAEAVRAGELGPGVPLGSLIEIHGEGGRGRNWTDGCVALSNEDMDDLFRRVDTGTLVTIMGGDGRDGAFSGLLARLDSGTRTARP